MREMEGRWDSDNRSFISFYPFPHHSILVRFSLHEKGLIIPFSTLSRRLLVSIREFSRAALYTSGHFNQISRFRKFLCFSSTAFLADIFTNGDITLNNESVCLVRRSAGWWWRQPVLTHWTNSWWSDISNNEQFSVSEYAWIGYKI